MRARRILAYLIDIVLIGILCGIIGLILGISPQALWTSGTGVSLVKNAFAQMSLVVSALYFLTDVLWGGSPGKKLLRLTVVRKVDAGAKFGQAIIRAIVKVISINLLFGIVLFFVYGPGSSLHDRISGTTVTSSAG